MNLLKETLEVLAQHEKSPADVQWVGGDAYWFTWDEFAELADREYDDGFGGQEVARDLVVVGDGWYMYRGEYDGSEWWNFSQPLLQPVEHRKPRGLFAKVGWDSLTDIDEDADPAPDRGEAQP